ncbi:MAG: methionyl-tRNA formyltransferase [Candidatus Pacebacteria bacterium]|nr:methionyl-tRNA formyltransferase [Candidatus Paceibacterota bacterium]
MNNKTSFIFFGSSRFSVIVLEELTKLGFIPKAIVTTPDKPQGRKLVMTPNVVKKWAIQHNSALPTEKHIEVYNPAKIDAAFIELLRNDPVDTFIVASFGKILPRELIEIPPHKTLNIHPSLLPQYRGASPLQAAILNDTKNTGVTIMRIDEDMDHGPIVAQKDVSMNEWPTYEAFEEMMAREGAKLLAEILPDWVTGKITETEQDHSAATYTRKTKKEDGLVDLSSNDYENFRKIQAYHEWPQAYFMISRDGKDVRVKVTAASLSGGKLIIEKVIPEGKNEMSYTDFTNGFKAR